MSQHVFHMLSGPKRAVKNIRIIFHQPFRITFFLLQNNHGEGDEFSVVCRLTLVSCFNGCSGMHDVLKQKRSHVYGRRTKKALRYCGRRKTGLPCGRVSGHFLILTGLTDDAEVQVDH
jgi:hypothetical protein